MPLSSLADLGFANVPALTALAALVALACWSLEKKANAKPRRCLINWPEGPPELEKPGSESGIRQVPIGQIERLSAKEAASAPSRSACHWLVLLNCDRSSLARLSALGRPRSAAQRAARRPWLWLMRALASMADAPQISVWLQAMWSCATRCLQSALRQGVCVEKCLALHSFFNSEPAI